MRACLVIPHHDHVRQFRALVPKLAGTGLPIIVTDDASPAIAFTKLEELLENAAPGATLLRHDVNQGKGGAVITGLRAAWKAGFTHAVQVDADGQHDIETLPKLLAEARNSPAALICGAPVFDESISLLRKRARLITHALCRLETLSPAIEDAMCGFRAYPLAQVIPLLEKSSVARRMGFDPEILVRACWAGMELRFVPVRVTYPKDGRSHFRYFADNVEICWMHTRLICGMLLRLPGLAWQRLRGNIERE